MAYPALSGWLAERKAMAKRASIQFTDVQKFLSNGKRRIQGLASSISVDRQGDIVEPKGGSWKLPLPLLWQHSHRDPVGWVRSIDVRSNGIWIEAEFAEGVGRADEVWEMVDKRLIDAFSIGFRGIDWTPLPDGGRRWEKWELLEVSCVVVPANPDAKISRQTGEGVKLVSAHPIQVVRGKGGVPLAKPKAGVGVKLIQPRKPIKLKRADGAIPLIGRK